jgi:hypothetical protein
MTGCVGRLLIIRSDHLQLQFAAAFAEDEQKQRQRNAFVESAALHTGSLTDVIADIAAFIMPHAAPRSEDQQIRLMSLNALGLTPRSMAASHSGYLNR